MESNNELINKLLEDIDYVTNIIDDMCKCIYQGEGNKIFNNLNKFINGLDLVLSKSSYISEEINIEKIDQILINLEKSISIKDYVLFADILIYELKPMIQEWIKELKNK